MASRRQRTAVVAVDRLYDQPIFTVNPRASLIRSPGVSYTVQMVSLWGLLRRTSHSQVRPDEDRAKKGCQYSQPLRDGRRLLSVGLLSAFCHLSNSGGTEMAEEERRSPRGARSKGNQGSSAEGD